MSGSYDAYDWDAAAEEAATRYAYKVGDLVRFIPSRKIWDYYDPWGYRINTPSEHMDSLGIVVERYRTYGSYSQIYYRIRWIDMGSVSMSNEKHEDLMLVSEAARPSGSCDE